MERLQSPSLANISTILRMSSWIWSVVPSLRQKERRTMSTRMESLQPRTENGWNSGLASLWRKENLAWRARKRWLLQGLIWLGLFNGPLAFVLFLALTIGKAAARGGPAVPPGMENPTALGLSLFFTLLVQFG